jgi:voltage-gated potassium channel
MNHASSSQPQAQRVPTARTARAELARRIEHWLELPMAVLGGVWLLLLIAEFLTGPTPLTDTLTIAIWIIFGFEFAARFLVAPRKIRFLRRNWITALALALPAVRVLRAIRIVRLMRIGRAARAVRIARLLTSFNRGMRALGTTMRTRGFPYVLGLTTVLIVLGAAGMYTFEHDQGNAPGFETFGSSLWWTAMLVTTMGSEFWPRTAEGRLVCLFLSIYAFAMFGYITATLASYFVGSDSSQARLERELAEIREALAGLSQRAGR